VAGSRRRRDERGEDAVSDWVLRLHDEYPGDVGVLSPAILNLVKLERGQALFLPAGELHAYLEGTAVELMANSDNVLRGGLTPKHVDVSALLGVLTFRETTISILEPEQDGSERTYPAPAREFKLSEICVDRHRPYRSREDRSVEIALCVSGTVTVRADGATRSLAVSRGSSFLVPAAAPAYSIEGDGQLFKATVP
jgi:mannose-6-phosphate isomerase